MTHPAAGARYNGNFIFEFHGTVLLAALSGL